MTTAAPARAIVPMIPRKFVALDGIRGIAAILVMMRHTSGMWGWRFEHSYLAVDLFFLLSGFVIANSYERKLADGRLTVAGFARLRLIRFYPMYLVALALSACLAWAPDAQDLASLTHREVVWRATLAMFFLPTLGAALFPLLGVTWSLFYELIVNLIYAVARPALTTRMLLSVSGLAYLALVTASLKHGSLDMGMAGNLAGVAEGLVRATFGIFLGIALYRLRTRLWARLPAIPPLAAIVALTALMCAPAIGPLWLIDVLSIPLMAPLVLLAARRPPPLGRAMLFLGSASYPIYLLHIPLHVAVERVLQMRGATPWTGLAFAMGTVLLGVAAERFYDLPLRRWLGATLLPRSSRLQSAA